jgi:hypothetical protein
MSATRLVPPSVTDRKRRRRVLRALRNTEVLTAEKIMQRYIVQFGGRDVEGRQQPGNVVLTPQEDSLKIYLKEQYFEIERNPYELVEKLGALTGIEERKNGNWLLGMVLTEPNPQKILDILAHYRVPMSYPEDDADAEWLDGNRPRRVPMPVDGTIPHLAPLKTLNILSSTRAKGIFATDDGEEDEINRVMFGNSATNSPLGPGLRIVAANKKVGRPGLGTPPVDELLEYTGEKLVSRNRA